MSAPTIRNADRKAGLTAPDIDGMLDMLLKRKLIVRGLGYTGRDALYNMLSDAFVLPYWASGTRRTAAALRLWFRGRITILDLLKLSARPEMSEDECRVTDLIKQTPLSTAELIRCFDRGISDVNSPDKVISGIYPDEESGQARLANESGMSGNADAVIRAVANLYLTRQVLLEIV